LSSADVNLLQHNIDAMNKITGTWIAASKEGGLEIKAERTTNIWLSRHQNANEIIT
jgi:hypothetical protein